jgi:hypothetical protein
MSSYLRTSSQLWRYGKGDASQEAYGRDKLVVGCSKSTNDEANDVTNDMQILEKWLVDVQCEGCRGLFYRSAPGVIVPDADWPRNGDIVVGYELATTSGRSHSLYCIEAVKWLCMVLTWPRLFSRLDPAPEWILSTDSQ